jgi:ABC-type multidrug transport system fused ATPase/permease subunit
MNGRLRAPGSLRALVRPYTARALATVAGIGVMSAFGAAYPYFSGRLIDSVVQRDALAAVTNAGAFTVCIIAAALLWTIDRYALVRLAADLGHDLRRHVFTKLVSTDLATVAAFSDARARTRVESDVKTLTDSLDTLLMPLAAAVIQLVALLVAVAWINLPLCGALLASLVPLFMLSRFDAGSTREGAERAAAAVDRFAAGVATYLSFGGILRARAFGRTAHDGAVFDEDSFALRGATLRMQQRGATRVLLVHSISAIITFAILVAGIEFVVNGHVTVGALVAFIAYQQMIWDPISRLARAPHQLASLRVIARRVDELLAQPELPNGHRRPAGHCITLRGATYRYPDGTIGIQNVSLEIRRGERIAIVGPSGSGKSTLAMVIQGLYLPQDGELCFDGVPADACDAAHLRDLFAYDAAGAAFVPGTVRRNITYAAPDDDPLHCAAAARDAHAADFVEALPDGYETLLDDAEHGFSTGQLRRLGIARALAAKRPFLVLDEPTGPLDPATASALFESLRSAAGGYVVATHDVGELVHFDRVLVMANNTVVYEMRASAPKQRRIPQRPDDGAELVLESRSLR